MIKPTKRKAFNFLRSYFDVLNELKTDSDRLNFLLSIINKQFLDEDPKKLNFIVNLCYESQRHQIESSVKGWERASNDTLSTTPPTTMPTDPKEEEEKEKEEEKGEVQEQEQHRKKVYSNEIHECFENCVGFFPSQLHPKENKTWLDTIEKLNRIEKIPLDIIESIVKKTREDDFWSSNFLSLTKLRKKNKDGVMYVIVFNEKIKSNEKTGNTSYGKTASTVSEEYIKRLNDKLLS